MGERSHSVETPAFPWVRLRPWCAKHQEHAVWMWRCFCYAQPLSGETSPWGGAAGSWQPFPQLCRCEDNGAWLCTVDEVASDCPLLTLEVPA